MYALNVKSLFIGLSFSVAIRHDCHTLPHSNFYTYLEKNPRIVPLFKIDIHEAANSYIASATPKGKEYELDPESLLELSRAWEAFERDMETSRQVTTLTMEEIDVVHSKGPDAC